MTPPPGDTLWDQAQFIHNDSELRNFVLNEPRGGLFRHVNLLVPPKNPEAQMGWIIMEPSHTPPMSGSNSICVATVLLETGIIPMEEPETHIILEAPGGLINIRATCDNGKVQRVFVQNVASFAGPLNQKLEIEGMGTLTVDTAYGGDSFVTVDSHQIGFSISPDEAKDLVEIGRKITKAANEQLMFTHPTNKDWTHFSFTQIHSDLRKIDGVKTYTNTVVIDPGKLDRSPTGTGLSARMAILHAKDEISVGEPVIARSIIGSSFEGKILQSYTQNGIHLIEPEISGRAWITGSYQHYLDPSDPWPQGYRVTDTWPQRPF